MKGKIGEFELMEMKNFVLWEPMWRSEKTGLQNGENYLQSIYPTKDKYLVYSQYPIIKTQLTQLGNGQRYEQITKEG